MTKTALATLAFIFVSSAQARVPLKDVNLRVLHKGKVIGFVSMTDTNQKDEILLVNDSGGTITLADGTQRTVKSGAKHILSSDWKWKSSVVNMPLSKDPVKITVGNKDIRLDMMFDKQKIVRNYPYTGMVFPRRAFYQYLRTISPPPKMQPNEVYILNEIYMTLQKVTWTYLGTERTLKGKIHKYEFKGLDTVVTFDEKMNIERVKELDIGLELVKN